jgi:hypothetical protein
LEIFLSYCWADKKIADKIDQDFSQLSLKVVRDIRDLEFKQNLKEFMQKITMTDYVIIILSENYLKSKNCMYEALELMTHNKIQEKILPIVKDGTKLDSTNFRIELINYWDEQATILQEKIRNVSAISATKNLATELREIESIRNDIDDFVRVVKEQKYSNWTETRRNNYSEILKYLGLENSDNFEQAIAISKIIDPKKRNRALEMALINNPENIALQTLKAVLFVEEGEFELARTLFINLSKKHPLNSNFKYNLAVIENTYFNNPQLAEKLYREVLMISPNDASARVNLAIIWIETKQHFDEAKNHLLISLNSNPDPSRALFALGKLYLSHFNIIPDALKYLSLAIQVKPDFQEAITLKALVEYNSNSDISAFSETMKSCIEIDKSNYFALAALGEKLLDYEDRKHEGLSYITQAKEILENKIIKNPHDYNSKLPLAYILETFFSEYEKASKLLSEVLPRRKDLGDFKR